MYDDKSSRNTMSYKLFDIPLIDSTITKASQPVDYNYLLLTNFQQLKNLLKLVKPQELTAKRNFLVSNLQYASKKEKETNVRNMLV